MPFEQMDLDELHWLQAQLAVLCKVGKTLADAGLDPVFDLTPGRLVGIQLGIAMPNFNTADMDSAQSGLLRPTEAPPPVAACPPAPIPTPFPVASVIVVPEHPAPDPFAPSIFAAIARMPEWDAGPGNTPERSGADDTAGPAPEQTAATPAGAADPVSGGGAPAKAAADPAANPFTGQPWTEGEKIRLIDLVARGMALRNETKATAMRAAAEELNRPFPGLEFQAKKLKYAIAQRCQELSQSSREKAAAEPETAPRRPPAVVAHVDDLPRLTAGLRWTIDMDAELLRLHGTGAKLAEIALTMAIDAGKLRARHDVLTDHHKIEGRDGTASWLRRFSPADVLAELERRMPKAAE